MTTYVSGAMKMRDMKMSINTTYECIEMFKHGVADGLLEGTRDDNRENDFWYKSGYDYGITLYGRLEK